MASKKKKAAKGAAGAVAAGKAVASNEYVTRLVEDEELRDNLRTAYESARNAYSRMSNGKGPAKALFDDKKTQKELQNAASELARGPGGGTGPGGAGRGSGTLVGTGSKATLVADASRDGSISDWIVDLA